MEQFDPIEQKQARRTGILIQGFDIFSVVDHIGVKTKKHQATLLAGIEEVIDKDSKEFLAIRKLVLDSTNNLSRSIVSSLFGDIER